MLAPTLEVADKESAAVAAGKEVGNRKAKVTVRGRQKEPAN